MRTSQYIAFFLLSVISAVAIIVGMATLEWRTNESSGVKTVVGLKQYKVTYSGQSSTADIPNTGDFVDYLKGADTALSMGVIALACIAFNVVVVALLKLCQGWTGGRARFIAIIFSLAACVLIIVGTVTFDQKLSKNIKDNTDYGYSFGLYVAGGMLPFFIALALFLQKEL